MSNAQGPWDSNNYYNMPPQGWNQPPMLPGLFPEQDVSPYSRTTSLLLCCLGLFLVGGLHRFYAGKYISGLIYLLTGGLFYGGTLVDLFFLARGTFTDAQGRPIVRN